ncbi:hypothetical protein DFR70_11560 [Nocardia tenerifensis]|uniref:Uncharacterized protein n=1 Tax=Nocardia tenerifensis TaxID=228006 RepID=A0A318KEW5_9NOCA|nr:hypothetical protein [Nocardia tenerifensis]PXX58087.1 hypothetical protein DFR70_11560 [Nocardia tenerifensis]
MAAHKYGTFALGLCAGAGLAARWRPLLGKSVRQGITGTALLSRSMLRYVEDVADLIQEARAEAGASAGTALSHGGKRMS